MEQKDIVTIDADLADLIPGYLARRQEDIAAIRSALMEGDFEQVRVLGHSMKGSGGGYGFDRITEIGRHIEEAAKDKNTGRVMSCTDELAEYLSRIEIVYE